MFSKPKVKNLCFAFLIFFSLLSANSNLYGQVNAYAFSQSLSTYTPLSGLTTTAYSGAWDDHTAGSAVQATLPFSFTYDGVSFTQCYISPNGFITFGANQPSPTTYVPINDNTNYNTATTGGVVSALGINLKAGSAASNVKYGVVGVFPNRTFVIEWTDADRVADAGNFDFQIRLSETTNVIVLSYGSCQPLTTNIHTVQVGLRGPNNNNQQGNTFNRSLISSQTWFGNTSTGPGPGSNIFTEVIAYPNNGLMFTYTPPLPCTTPSAQPSNLVVGATSITDVAITGNSFTAASPPPTKYLVLRRETTNIIPTAAVLVNRTYYPVGSQIFPYNIFVMSSGPSLTFTNSLPVVPDTTYYYYIVPYNDSCQGGPVYNLSGIIWASATTCSQATVTSTGAVGGNNFIANWNLVAGATNYFIDVSTNAAFTAMVPGYTNLSLGNVSSINVTGLFPATTYYFRVRAQGIGCQVNSNVSSATTTCGYYTIPYYENFDILPTGVVPPCAARTDGNSDGTQWQTQAVNFSSASRSMQIDKNTTTAMNDWYYTPALNLTAGVTYRLFFRYNTGTVAATSENLRVYYGSTQDVAGMTNSLLTMTAINNTTFLTKTVDFTPTSSGNFYIGFQGSSNANQTYIVIDDISVTLSPACVEPSNVSISAITSTTATVSWTIGLPSPLLGFQYYISPSNVAPTAATVPTGSVGAGIATVNLTLLSPNTYYYVWVRGNCSAVDKSIWTPEQSFNTECVTPVISSTTPVSRCGYGTATINATPNITSTVYWYDAPTGGALLGTGNNFTTPGLSTNTTYYAEAKANGALAKLGPTSPTSQGGSLAIQNFQTYITFSVIATTYLQSLDIYPMVSGQPGILAIRNSSNVTLALFPYVTSTTGGATAQQLTMNYQLTPGNYNLYFEALPASGLRMNGSLAVYPYASTVASITGNGIDFGYNLGCYNWKFTTECVSPRIPVAVTITSPPALSLSTNNITICDGTSSSVVTVNGYAAYNSLVWTPSTGVSGSFAAGFTFNPTTTTTYTLVANQSSGSFCGNRVTITVDVIPSPSLITVLPNSAIQCASSIQALTGSTSAATPTVIFSEDFNAATNSWVVANTSVGGDVIASQWTLRPNNYNYVSTFWNATFVSNDASQFYLANADAQTGLPDATGIITNTTLTSPSMNLTGYTSATLSFWHYVRYIDSDSFLVQVSTNNGASWTTVSSYITLQGTSSSFLNTTVNLNAYLGAPNVKIRFNFGSFSAYGWAIDNVSVTGTLLTALTWVPATGLYNDSAATDPYIANTAQSIVYAKPSITTTYTATLTGANSCFRNATSTITVVPLSVGGTVSSDQYVCSGTTPSNLTLAGNVGAVVRWEYADDLAFTQNVTSIANTTTTLPSAQMGTFSAMRYFRAVVKNGICNEANSSVVFVGPQSTTWNGSSWSNGEPTASIRAIFNGDFNSGTNISVASLPNLRACSVVVNSGAVVFNATHSLIATNEVIVSGGSLTFENNSSLVQTNEVFANSGNITYKRTTFPMKKFDYTYWSTPVFPQTLLALSPLTPADKYYRFDQVVNYWVSVPSNNIMDIARGYIIRAPFQFDPVTPSLYNATFYGVPNNGTYTLPIVVNTGDYNLIGNPYPSALNINAFLSYASNIPVVDATVYLWTHNTPITANQYASNDYAVYNYLGGTGTTSAPSLGINSTVPTGKIASGQSFFIKGRTNANVTFTNAMRIAGNNDQFFRMEQPNANSIDDLEKHRLWLDVLNNQGVYKQILVGYAETATNGIDRGFDGEFMDAGNGTAIYSLCNGKKFNIQGKALPFTVDDEVPLGFKGNVSGDYQISLHEFDGLFLNQDVFLKDTFLNVIHNLKQSPYLFHSEAGSFDNRFVIVYLDATLGNPNVIAEDNAVVIYKPNENLIINSGNKIMKEVKIFDVRGRLLLIKSDINANETAVELGNTNQVFLIQITTDDLRIINRKYVN